MRRAIVFIREGLDAGRMSKSRGYRVLFGLMVVQPWKPTGVGSRICGGLDFVLIERTAAGFRI